MHLDAGGFVTPEGAETLRTRVAQAVTTEAAFRAFCMDLPSVAGGCLLNPDAVFEALFGPFGVDAHERQAELLGEDLHETLCSRNSAFLNACTEALPAGVSLLVATGANGAGKSTLIRTLHGLEAPYQAYLEMILTDPMQLYARLRDLLERGIRVTLAVVHAPPPLSTSGVVVRGLDTGRFVAPLVQGRSHAVYGTVLDLYGGEFASVFGDFPNQVPMRVRTHRGELLKGGEALAQLQAVARTYELQGRAEPVARLAAAAFRDRLQGSGDLTPAQVEALRRHGG